MLFGVDAMVVVVLTEVRDAEGEFPLPRFGIGDAFERLVVGRALPEAREGDAATGAAATLVILDGLLVAGLAPFERLLFEPPDTDDARELLRVTASYAPPG